MIKRCLIFGDSHLETNKEVDKSYLLFKSVVRRTKPDILICLGDVIDYSYISRFADIGETEGKRLADDIALLKEELQYFRKYTKESVIYLQGNHEDRLHKLMNRNPVLIGLIDVDSICKDLNVTYIPTQQQPCNLKSLGYDIDLYLTHGLTYTKHFAAKLVESVGASIIQGHTHRTQMYAQSFPDGHIVKSYGVGSLTNITEYYEKGKRITGHSNSFAELLIDDETKTWQINLIMIENESCIMNGKVYRMGT